ncbi:MAG: hypothetical protein ACLTZ1_03005 [Blautia sp.]
MAGKNQFEDPYERLANAIILSAVADYRAALKKIKHNPKSKAAIDVTYHVNILAVRHSFRTVRCIVRNISLYIQRTELMQQSVAMVPSGSVREGSS